MQVDGLTSQTQIVAGFGVRLDGINRSAAFGNGWSVTHDAMAAYASASLPVIEPFALAGGRHTIAVYAGWGGDTSQPVFVGEVTNRTDTYYPHGSTLTAGGYLKRTDVGLDVQIGYYYSGGTSGETAAVIALIPAGYEQIPIATDADLIVNIIEHYGITPATTGHHIEASSFIPAKLNPIIWDIGTSGWRIIQQLDAIADYATSDGRLGQVLRKQVFGSVPAATRHTFVQGVDILDLGLSTAYEVYNQVKVTGGAIPGDATNAPVIGIAPSGTPPASPYIPDPPGVRTDDGLSSDFIETVADAQTIAARRLARLSQPLQEITLTTLGCADLDIDDGIRVDAPVLSLTTNAFIITHTIGGSPFQSVLKLRGSTSAATRTNAPPTPQVLISVILEHVIISGSLTPLAMITVDARASSDSDGTITGWTIALDGATYSGTDITTAVISHATPNPSPIAVSVAVTDNSGLTGTITQSAVWDAATALVEALTLAELNQGEASGDGELTWAAFAAPITAVAPIALGGTTLWGCSDGKVYRSLDLLLTAPTLAHTFPAAVNCLWDNETATDRWLAGLTNGDLWASIDDGLTWVKLHTFASAVNDCSESPAAPGELTVCSGESLWHSFDTGATWAALVTKVGATALRFAAAHFAGVDRAFVGFNDGTIAATTGPTITLPTVAQIRGLTISLDATELYILTDSPATYSYTEAGGIVAGPPTGTATNRAIRSGAGTWVYAATDGALQKLLPHKTVYDVRVMTTPRRALAVGYGSVGPPIGVPQPLTLELYVPTTYTSTLGGVWHFTPAGGWTRLTSGLPLNVLWYWIAASPLNPNVLAMIGNSSPYIGYPDQFNASSGGFVTMGNGKSPVWISTNGGASWTEAPCKAGPDASMAYGFYQIEFSKTTPGRWYTVGRTQTAAGLRITRWSGDLTTPRDPITDIDINHDTEFVTQGDAEDSLTSYHDGANQIVYYPTPPAAHPTGILETVDPTDVPRDPGPDKPNMDVQHGSRKLWALEGWRSNNHRLWYVDDYRLNTIYETNSDFFVSSGANAGYVTCTADGAYIGDGNGTWEVKVIPPPPAPNSWTVNTTKTMVAEPTFQLRADRQAGRVMAGRSRNDASKYVLFDGTTWGTMAGPPEPSTDLAGFLEVVSRGG